MHSVHRSNSSGPPPYFSLLFLSGFGVFPGSQARAETAATTLYAVSGRLIPLSANSPTGEAPQLARHKTSTCGFAVGG
jgi:hypothetical protein